MPDGDGAEESAAQGQHEEGDRVEVTMPAFLLEEFDDGSALVDADGKEILVAEDEWHEL
jgi:hypothetical protein